MVEKRIGEKRVWVRWEPVGGMDVKVPFGEESYPKAPKSLPKKQQEQYKYLAEKVYKPLHKVHPNTSIEILEVTKYIGASVKTVGDWLFGYEYVLIWRVGGTSELDLSRFFHELLVLETIAECGIYDNFPPDTHNLYVALEAAALLWINPDPKRAKALWEMRKKELKGGGERKKYGAAGDAILDAIIQFHKEAKKRTEKIQKRLKTDKKFKESFDKDDPLLQPVQFVSNFKYLGENWKLSPYHEKRVPSLHKVFPGLRVDASCGTVTMDYQIRVEARYGKTIISIIRKAHWRESGWFGDTPKGFKRIIEFEIPHK